MKVEISVPEVIDIFKEIQGQPEKLFEIIRVDIKETVGNYLTKIMEAELTNLLGREQYERVEGNDNYRNGSYARKFTLKGIGTVGVDIPRDRNGEFKTQVIPRSKQYEDVLRQDLSLLFLSGVSTRTLAMMSNRLIGRKISPTEISNANKELIDAVEKWRTRDLSSDKIKYLFLDGVCFNMRISDSIETVPVLVIIGVTEDGHKKVLGFQSGDQESASTWREFIKDLKERELNSQDITLGIMDGLPGLKKVFREEFPRAKVQSCQVHMARNVLAKVPRKLKQGVADDIRSIFYASTKDKAMDFFNLFKEKWKKKVPSAVKCLEKSIDVCLTFFSYPEEDWISIRTTNVIERLNKEFKRRTKSMEILAGENSCYLLITFVCFKMELTWKAKPIGRVKENLPRTQKWNEKLFTHKS